MKKRQKTVLVTFIVVVCVLIAAMSGFMLIRQYYPLEYRDVIKSESAKYGLDPYFVCSIIWTESKFKENAVSEDGAQGLMQLMPSTAEWIAKKMDDKNVSADNAMDPATNIAMGCWYLDHLMDKFKNEELVAAAYNAGQGKVTEWLKDKTVSKDGEVLHNIPYEETRNYVERVDRAYDFYKALYSF